MKPRDAALPLLLSLLIAFTTPGITGATVIPTCTALRKESQRLYLRHQALSRNVVACRGNTKHPAKCKAFHQMLEAFYRDYLRNNIASAEHDCHQGSIAPKAIWKRMLTNKKYHALRCDAIKEKLNALKHRHTEAKRRLLLYCKPKSPYKHLCKEATTSYQRRVTFRKRTRKQIKESKCKLSWP